MCAKERKGGNMYQLKENEKFISPEDKALQYMGRIDFEDTANPVWVNPCTYVKVRFTGNYIRAIFTNIRSYWTNYIGVIIDGEQKKIALNHDREVQDILLGDNLGDTEHELLLFKRMDSCHLLVFHGLIVDKDAVISAPEALPKRRIEVYGDSVSAGEVSEAVDYVGLADPEHDGEFSNSYYSYSWCTARRLNAQLHAVAQGGIALLDGTGYFNWPDFLGMEWMYDKIQYNPGLSAEKSWDFSRYTPHVVIVAIGQNDNHPDNYMAEDYNGEKAVNWRNHYEGFIRRLREIYPKAHIILSTTILGHDKSWDDAIDEVCERMQDERIHHFMYSNNGCGTQGHIRIPEAEKMAEELSAYIETLGDDVWEDA